MICFIMMEILLFDQPNEMLVSKYKARRKLVCRRTLKTSAPANIKPNNQNMNGDGCSAVRKKRLIATTQLKHQRKRNRRKQNRAYQSISRTEQTNKKNNSLAQRNRKRRNERKLIYIFIWHVLMLFFIHFLSSIWQFLPFEMEPECTMKEKYLKKKNQLTKSIGNFLFHIEPNESGVKPRDRLNHCSFVFVLYENFVVL